MTCHRQCFEFLSLTGSTWQYVLLTRLGDSCYIAGRQVAFALQEREKDVDELLQPGRGLARQLHDFELKQVNFMRQLPGFVDSTPINGGSAEDRRGSTSHMQRVQEAKMAPPDGVQGENLLAAQVKRCMVC